MTVNTQKQVVVIAGPTGPTGTMRGVRILSAFTGPTGTFPVWEQLAGPTGPSGTFETVYDASGLSGGFKTVAIAGYSGGGADWLPAGAVVFSDFVNAHYYAGGAATTLADLWYENTDWSVWDPALVVNGVGLTSDPNNSAPTLSRAYSTPILAGGSFYVRVKAHVTAATALEIAASELPGYTKHREVDPVDVDGTATYSVQDWQATSDDSNGHTSKFPAMTVVVAYAPTTVRVSMNGDPVTSHVVSAAGSPLTDIEFGLLDSLGSGAVLTDITIWSGVPTDQVMQTLSA